MKNLITLFLCLAMFSAMGQTKKPDSIRGQLTSNPPIDGWFIDGKFVADKELTSIGKGYTAIYFGGLNVSTYKVHIPNSTKNWIFQSLDDNKRVALIVKDTLWVNRPFDEIKDVKEAVFELRYLRYKGKVYRYSRLFFDPSYFWTRYKKGIVLW